MWSRNLPGYTMMVSYATDPVTAMRFTLRRIRRSRRRALPLSDPAAARAAGAVMALLRAAGFDAQSALKTLATITSYVVGVAQWEVGTAPYRAERGGAPFPLPADADPYLVELAPQLAEDDCDETFEFGLDVIVRGLETRS